MKKQISLNGQWLLKYTDYGSGERFNLHSEGGTDGWLPALVPGDVHLDMMNAGIIADPFYGTNSEHCLWMEEKDWWYRKTFALSENDRPSKDQHVYLLFEGLDNFATIYLNGELLAKHCNMFVPLRLDITDIMVAGENDLRVCLGASTYSPKMNSEIRTARSPMQRLWSRKAQASYGWDIAPRLVTTGIWRSVEIQICSAVEIIDSWVQTTKLSDNHAEIELEFSIGLNDDTPHQVYVEIELFDQKKSVELSVHSPVTQRRERFVLDNPPLWWPHNHGAPELVPYSITVSEENCMLDEFFGRFGVRTVELIQEPVGESKSSFYFEINGKTIFLKGMNWTPPDSIYARIDDERYGQLIEKTMASNINALRVWGGGIYESKTFYNLCDENGILVWQDFMFACGVYPQSPEFLHEVRNEAQYIVRSLRGHPSIFIWCGDNEVDWVYVQENIPDFWNNKINRDVLPNICRELDPSRPYIHSTPFSFGHEHPNNPNQGNVHLWKHGSSYRDDFYVSSFPNMVTEMGHISLPDLEVVKSFIPDDKLWPPFNEQWYLHCSDPSHGADRYRVGSWFESIQSNGLPEPRDLQTLINRTQQLQAEATTFWIEHFSSQPACWGLFLWNLCDCWPQVSDAYIAYPLHEKPALKAVRNGYAKILR
ncbi:hypothetical protein JW960_27900 [candidate division KSB1 bacterium]|nr:hypothetical protein [candidate division KSB1 bacterium]